MRQLSRLRPSETSTFTEGLARFLDDGGLAPAGGLRRLFVERGRLPGLALVAVLAVWPAASLAQDLGTILDKATAYVEGYAKALTSVVSEERYEQHVSRTVSRGDIERERQVLSRTLLSDYLLVQIPGSTEWAPFRDVYSVDGVAVRDRNDRLVKLFLLPSASSIARALEIRAESSRYNIGSAVRDINVPTFALQFLSRDQRSHFTFTDRGRERIGTQDVVVIEYQEKGRPTLIRGHFDEDLPASGRFYVAPDTGAVVRSVLETRPENMQTRIEVSYRYEPSMTIFVPSEMREHHEVGGDEQVEGRSTYANFRRFQVTTTIQIK